MDLKVVLTGTRRWCTRRVRQWVRRAKVWYILRMKRKDVLVCYIPFQGYHCRSVLARGARLTDPIVTFPPPERSLKRVKTGQQSPQGAPQHLAAVETELLGKVQSLVAHCCVTRYDDGTPRRPGWVTIQTFGAAWVVQVKDPDGGCQLRATASTLDDALALADLLLGSDDAPWEPDPWLAKNKNKEKKAA